ncbi:DUF3466 family protein [Grimontia marina]|uniref:Uncharacterized protein n=1 Tax=Grimontia marina TaxID=646534 RepID=A0A128EZU9_9GAMM|nr:DUF3466 family protein [Grimontia marina]CZF79526.1 hypothetical protein GMA8713_01017 [Grimontia marina]
MQFNKFKLSAIALAIAGIPAVANAAYYQVQLLDSPSSNSSQATAISSDSSKVAVEGLSGPVGLNYSEELPYMVDVEHFINSQDDLYRYCRDYLGYNTCEEWADEKWYGVQASGTVCNSQDSEQNCLGGLKKEIDAWTQGFSSNSVAKLDGADVNPFGDGIEDTSLSNPDPASTNVVINAVSGSIPVGASSSPYFKVGSNNARAFQRRGFYGDAELLPPTGLGSVIDGIGQTNANGVIDAAGKTIVFGSASVANMADAGNGNKVPQDIGLGNLSSCANSLDYSDRACQYFQFANQASIWLASGITENDAVNAFAIADFQTPSNAPTGNTDDTAQASVNAAAMVSGATAPTMVGFNTYNDSRFYARAVKYTPVNDFANCIDGATKRCWEMSLIPGVDIRQGGDIVYRYTEATDINSNGLVVGVAKSARLNNGAYAETIFVNAPTGNGDETKTTLLGSSQNALFFTGYNGTAAAINVNNELVGKVDTENARDRSRRQRGYIYAHGGAIGSSSAWLLDDLTNDGNASGNNNQFRIAEAFDINDDGAIAASAFYCAGGYSSVAHDARCNGTEELVAVKLTRDDTAQITARPYEVRTIERSGGGIGVLGLGLLALGGIFRRKK